MAMALAMVSIRDFFMAILLVPLSGVAGGLPSSLSPISNAEFNFLVLGRCGSGT
jgi:hypothetical protein